MGVSLVNDSLETPIEEVVEEAKVAAKLITVNY
jgi:phosphoribosylglycinamide formyltransferase 2